MTKLPSPAVRNAIAFVDFYGNFPSHCQITTRLSAQRWEDGGYIWVKHNEDRSDDPLAPDFLRFYAVTDEGLRLAQKGSLAKALDWLKSEGFTYRNSGRKPSLNYIKGFKHDDGRTAWISGGEVCRVYINCPLGHPLRKNSGSELVGEFRVG